MSKKIPVNSLCPCGSGIKYKKWCGSPHGNNYLVSAPEREGLSREKLLYAYSDETGNTGNNLFDEEQPYFWTGTLISECDIENEG